LNTEELSKHIRELELELLSPDTRRNPAELDKLIDNNFVEIGKSGKVWNKKSVIDALLNEPDTRITITDFSLTKISEDVVLAIYKAYHNHLEDNTSIMSIRSSVWKLSNAGWKIIFHQGTKVSG
jgi:glyoxylase I family protein